MAAYTEISSRLIPSLETLLISLKNKSEEFNPVVKIGRTHLQDALPVTLGQEFSGYAKQVQDNIQRFSGPLSSLSCLALGGTAIGTGVNTHPDFAGRVIQMISQETGYNFREAENHFSAQAAQDAAVETSGVLKTLAVSLFKIANDIRWLASGPRCGLGEINLPALQPGSSIMPGKVNPVIPEAVIQAAAQVMGNDTAITLGGQGGTFELNTMLPLIAYNLLQSIRILGCAAEVFAGRCVEGVTANQELCASRVEQSLAMATFIVPVLGYDRAAMIADEAHETGKTILEVLQEKKILSEEELQKVFGRIF
jgi:fumarate hydratase class II